MKQELQEVVDYVFEFDETRDRIDEDDNRISVEAVTNHRVDISNGTSYPILMMVMDDETVIVESMDTYGAHSAVTFENVHPSLIARFIMNVFDPAE